MDTGTNKLPRVNFMFIKIMTEYHVVDEVRHIDRTCQVRPDTMSPSGFIRRYSAGVNLCLFGLCSVVTWSWLGVSLECVDFCLSVRIMIGALPSSSTVLHIYIPTWTNTKSSYYVMSGARSCWLKYYIVTLILRIIACSHVSYEVHPPSIKYHIDHRIPADPEHKI